MFLNKDMVKMVLQRKEALVHILWVQVKVSSCEEVFIEVDNEWRIYQHFAPMVITD